MEDLPAGRAAPAPAPPSITSAHDAPPCPCPIKEGAQSMVAPDAPEQQGPGPKDELIAASLPGCSDCGTLILDGQGRICACSIAAATLFGDADGRLIGRRISDFVLGILFDGDSAGDHAKRLRRLGTDNEWRQYEALDGCRRRLTVAGRLSSRTIDDHEVFVLDFREKAP